MVKTKVCRFSVNGHFWNARTALRIDDDEHILLKVHDCNEAFALLAAQLWALFRRVSTFAT